MKKLTAGIFATLLAVVSVDGAYAAIASKGYVDEKVGTVTTALGNKADKTELGKYATTEALTSGLAGKLDTTGTAAKATADAAGNVITDTYATKTELGTKADSATVTALDNAAEKIANRVTTVSDASDNTHYPTAKAVWDVVQAETSDIASTSDLSALTTRVTTAEGEIDTLQTDKQNKNMGAGAANHVVITDETGNIASAETIGADKVSGLANVAKTGAYDDLSGKPTIPTVDAAITEDSTNAVQSGAVYDALAAKADSADIPTTVAELTDADNYALVSTMNTELAKKQNSLTETQLNAVNSGITTTKVATYDGYAAKITANTEAIGTKANADDVTTLTERVAAVEAPKATVAEGVTAPVSGGTVYTAIQGVTGDVSGVTGRVNTLEGEMDTAQSDISSLKEASATHATKTELTDGLKTKQDKLTQTGSASQPVYVDATGKVTAGNTIPTVTTNIAAGQTDAAQAGAVATALAAKANSADVYTKEAANSTFIPQPGEDCTATGTKCVLVTNGTDFEWEVIARDGKGE